LRLVDVPVEIPLGNFAFRAEPNILEASGVTDTFVENADDVRPAADMGAHQGVNKLRRSAAATPAGTVSADNRKKCMSKRIIVIDRRNDLNSSKSAAKASNGNSWR
jgi:hypothetical protein